MQDHRDNNVIVGFQSNFHWLECPASMLQCSKQHRDRLRQSGNPRESLGLALKLTRKGFSINMTRQGKTIQVQSSKFILLPEYFTITVTSDHYTTKQLNPPVKADWCNLGFTWWYKWWRGEHFVKRQKRGKIERVDVFTTRLLLLLLFHHLHFFLNLSRPLGSSPILNLLPHSSLEMPPAPTSWFRNLCRLHDRLEQTCVLLMTPTLPVDVVEGEVRERGGGGLGVGAGPGFEHECRHLNKSRPAHGRRLTDSSYAGAWNRGHRSLPPSRRQHAQEGARGLNFPHVDFHCWPPLASANSGMLR